MTDNNTLEEYKQFTGTEHYFTEDFEKHSIEEQLFMKNYAYTDGIKYLKDHMSKESFQYMFINVVANANYKNPFVSAHLIIENEKEKIAKVVFYDQDLNEIGNVHVTHEGLSAGIYKMFMYNYVWLAASEY